MSYQFKNIQNHSALQRPALQNVKHQNRKNKQNGVNPLSHAVAYMKAYLNYLNKNINQPLDITEHNIYKYCVANIYSIISILKQRVNNLLEKTKNIKQKDEFNQNLDQIKKVEDIVKVYEQQINSLIEQISATPNNVKIHRIIDQAYLNNGYKNQEIGFNLLPDIYSTDSSNTISIDAIETRSEAAAKAGLHQAKTRIKKLGEFVDSQYGPTALNVLTTGISIAFSFIPLPVINSAISSSINIGLNHFVRNHISLKGKAERKKQNVIKQIQKNIDNPQK